jgi:hypothetical protein
VYSSDGRKTGELSGVDDVHRSPRSAKGPVSRGGGGGKCTEYETLYRFFPTKFRDSVLLREGSNLDYCYEDLLVTSMTIIEHRLSRREEAGPPVIYSTRCIIKWKGFGRMQSWLIVMVLSEQIIGRIEVKHENPPLGYPQSRSRFEPGTCLSLEPYRDINPLGRCYSINNAGGKNVLLIK